MREQLGRVPTSLVELYDQAAPDGMIELEIDRDGTIREMEADVPPSMLPDWVLVTARAAAPGGTVTGAEREIKAEGSVWEVKMTWEGRGWEFVIGDGGTVLESEKELQRSEAPAAILEAADRAIEGGAFKSVELIERGEATEYHVKKTRDGASYKIVLAPDGTVTRKVREARAEIEIPLAN